MSTCVFNSLSELNITVVVLVSLSLLLLSLTPLIRYTQNGILHMLDRNKRIKAKPERFQLCKDKFDLVITCEERVYDQVLEGEDFADKDKLLFLNSLLLLDFVLFFNNKSFPVLTCPSFVFSFLDLNSREQETLQPVHVINVDIQDNHEEATLGAFLICELCQCVSEEWGSQALFYIFFDKSCIINTYLGCLRYHSLEVVLKWGYVYHWGSLKAFQCYKFKNRPIKRTMNLVL